MRGYFIETGSLTFTAIRGYPPEERAIDVERPAGGVAFFAHATGPNTTDRERAGVALHFLLSRHPQERPDLAELAG